MRSGYVHHEGLHTGHPHDGLPVRPKKEQVRRIPQASRKLSKQNATELWNTGLIQL